MTLEQVTRLFPMTDNVLNDLVDEFRVVYSQADAALRANIQFGQQHLSANEQAKD